ncbi:hypothetical protein BDV95DRAFT_140222 [Massariosphaeria phaeospora]|uniref:Uncharacterized protein n=1 Tax=Massariosphaeria phaeospora TaxID=100035 RepID=A0A7C8IDV6_9PLEO|nr:hypothetical protein BDV95DRAFT_140222 [Massariosphaeria phaeospora]
MCNGSSSRTAQGGSIAILRPTQHSELDASHIPNDMRILFSNQADGLLDAGTQVEFWGCEKLHMLRDPGYWVIIHRDGDLTTPPPIRQIDPLFSFPLETDAAAVMQLSQRLDLGVGDVGIVGRRVSVMRGEREESLTVAEGIVGWN